MVAASRDESITFLAAAVAYYAFVSLVPLVVLSLVVATQIGGEAFADQVLGLLQQFLSEQARRSLGEALTGGAGRGSTTVISVVALLWSGLKVFRALDRAFSEVYQSELGDGFVEDMRDAVLALSTIGVAVVVAAVLGVVVQGFAGLLGTLLGILFVPGTLVVAFLPLYYFFPDVDVDLREALPGAVTAGLGWWILASGFGVYSAVTGSKSVYGAFGTALVFSTWLYFGAVIVVLGAVVNAVAAGHAGTVTDGGGGEDRL